MLQWFILGAIMFFVVFIFHCFWEYVVPHKFIIKHPYKNKFISGVLVGLIIEGLLLLSHNQRWLMDIEDASMDFVMQAKQPIQEDYIPSRQNKSAPPFVLLDIDEKTYESWDYPSITPRNRVKNLIDAAVRAKAKVIVVDINLSKESLTADEAKMPQFQGLKLQEGLPRHPYDQELYSYVANYPDYCKQENLRCPPIIIVRDFHFTEKDSSLRRKELGVLGAFHSKPEPILKARLSFLEKAVTQANEKGKEQGITYIYWASPLFIKSFYDGLLRRWWLWHPICENDSPTVIPSVQLLTAILVDNDTPQDVQAKVGELNKRFKKSCDAESYVPEPLHDHINFGKTLRLTGEKGVNSRIFFQLRWLPSLPYFLKDYNQETGKSDFVLKVLSAKDYAESSPQNVDLDFEDKIVVIGGSHGSHIGDGDWHVTPLGVMPGDMVVINAIHSLLQYGELKTLQEERWLFNAILLMSMIAIVSLIFTFFGGFWVVAFFGTAIIFGILPFSIKWLFENGVWFGFALPLMAVQLHHIAADLHKEKKHEKEKTLNDVPMIGELKEVSEQNKQIVASLKTVGEQNQLLIYDLRGFVEQNQQVIVTLQQVCEQNSQIVSEIKTLSEQDQEVTRPRSKNCLKGIT